MSSEGAKVDPPSAEECVDMSPGLRLALSAPPAAIVTLALMGFMQFLIAERPGSDVGASSDSGIRFGTVEIPKPPPPPTPTTIQKVEPKPMPPDAPGFKGPATGTRVVPSGNPDAPTMPTLRPPDFRSHATPGFVPGMGDGLIPVSMISPAYPVDAAMRGIEGWVEVEFTVRIDGSTGDVRIVGAEPRKVFDSAAIAAVQRWRFQAPTVDGAAQTIRTQQRITFVLTD
jgi:periplasmic protein TonB